MISKAAIALAASLVASSVSAQETTSPTAATIPQDVLGVKIGMTLDQAMAQLQNAYPNARPKFGTGKHRTSGQEYTSMIRLNLRDNGVTEQIWVYLTGHYSGNRVYSIFRKIDYPRKNPASLSDTRDAVLSKLGVPTMFNRGAKTLNYIYKPEPLLFDTPENIEALMASGEGGHSNLLDGNPDEAQIYRNMKTCLDLIAKVQDRKFFDPIKATGDTPADCDAGVTVKMSGSDDLLRSLEMRMSDFRFVLESAKVDQAGEQGNAVDPQPTADTPKL